MLAAVLKGAMISGSLIIAIGGQNAFVLKQGLLRQHVFWVALICFLCDLVLIGVGVYGMGVAIGKNETLSALLALCGGIFLLVYGWRSFRAAFAMKHDVLEANDAPVAQSLKATILMTLAVTLLNPHVYLDTVVLIGSLAAPLSITEKGWFLVGATSVSLLWFFGLSYGARLLKPLFANPRAWQVLECGIGVMMWWLASGLLLFCYRSLAGLGV